MYDRMNFLFFAFSETDKMPTGSESYKWQQNLRIGAGLARSEQEDKVEYAPSDLNSE
jgi:hypothetical protein